jgi:hypothetical protein
MATNQGNQGGNKQGGTSNRGFASMDPAKQREIASLGGRAAHASGNAHEFTSEEARAAGSKSHGGRKSGGNQGARSGESGGGESSGNRGGKE